MSSTPCCSSKVAASLVSQSPVRLCSVAVVLSVLPTVYTSCELLRGVQRGCIELFASSLGSVVPRGLASVVLI